MITLRERNSGARKALTDEGRMPAPTDPRPTPRLDLGTFQILPENRSAVRAAKGLARSVLTGKRPPAGLLVLHGPPGSGKTQLTTALVNAVVTKSPEVTARVLSVGDLARPEDEVGFADGDLLACDFLALEDVQRLPERAADALCDLIDRRASRRKLLLVTASTGPARLTHLPHRLTSRLAAGLVVQLEPPGVTSRRVILEATAVSKNLRLTPDALDWLAGQGSGVRASLGLLQNLAQVAPTFPGPLDRNVVEQVIAGTGQPTSRGTDLQAIMKRVTATFGVTEKQLLGASRLRPVLIPRQVAMYLARELTGLSLPRIAAAFGRDHTTVLHACRKIEADTQLAGVVRELRAALG